MEQTKAERVCVEFVKKYYAVLHHLPHDLYKFYEDENRQSSSGSMVSRDNNCIYQMVVRLDKSERNFVVKTYDAVESHCEGIHMLVTGSVSRRDFIQTFILAPQEKKDAYFVACDVARFIDADESKETVPHMEALSTTNDVHLTDLPVQAPASQEAKLAAPALQAETSAQEDNPKKSWADIVRKEPPKLPTKAAPSTKNALNVFSTIADNKQATSSTSSSLKVTPPAVTPALQRKDFNGKDLSRSIYVSNLPHNITPSQLKEEFKKFGAIKPNGVQIKTKHDGYCFGFIAFEQEISVQKALEASPIIIKQKPALIARKREFPHQGSTAADSNGRGGYHYSALHWNYESREGYSNRYNNNREIPRSREAPVLSAEPVATPAKFREAPVSSAKPVATLAK